MKMPRIKHNSNFPIIHLRPMLFAALGFICGILCLFQYVIYDSALPFILFSLFLFVFVAISVLYFLRKKVKILLFCALITLVFGICGGFIAYLQVVAYEREEFPTGYYTVYGTVKEVSLLEDGHSLLLDDLLFKSHEETFSSGYQMNLIVFNKREEICQGARIKAYVRVSKQEKGEYYAFQMTNDIKFVAFTGNSDVFVVGKTKNFFDKIRLKGISILEKYLDGDALAVSKGMIFGDTEGMREDTLNQFRKLGIAHIFAVSGLHIGFLCLILTKLLRKTEAKNPIRFLLPSFAVFLYAGVCGFTPSALRAAIMCATALLFTCIGVPYDALSGVLFSAIVVLTVNPADVTSYGFILSYACVLSILIVSPMFKRILRRLPTKIGDSLAISIGIQIGVFPIQMLLFGYAAPLSVLLNLIFIPIITPIYIVLVLSVVFTAFLPSFGIVLTGLYQIFEVLLLVLDKIPNTLTIENLSLSRGAPVYYLGILLSSYHVNLRKSVKIILSSACFAAFILLV